MDRSAVGLVGDAVGAAGADPLDRGYTITVTRRDGPHLTPVLTCQCHA